MKICMLIRILPTHAKGGMQDHALMLAKGLKKNGHDVTIITTRHPRGIECEDIDGVQVLYLKNTIPGRYSRSWWAESVKATQRLLEAHDFDIIHGQSAGARSLLTKKINRKYNVPIILSFHGITYDNIKTTIRTYFSPPNRYLLKVMAKILYYLYVYSFIDLNYVRRADAIIATSNEQMNRIRSYFVDEKRVFKVFNGIDTDQFFPNVCYRNLIKKQYNIDNGDRLILSAARLTSEKGVQYTIQALPALLEKHHNLKLLVVGDGPYMNDLRKLVEKLRLESKVIFTGFVPLEKLPQFFNACDIFVNSTIRENGYDLTILEAMACEKPVVVSKLGSVLTVIKNEENGLLVPPKDINSLAKTVDELLDNPGLMSHIGQNARNSILGDFSLDSMCQRTVQVYKSVTESYKNA